MKNKIKKRVEKLEQSKITRNDGDYSKPPEVKNKTGLVADVTVNGYLPYEEGFPERAQEFTQELKDKILNGNDRTRQKHAKTLMSQLIYNQILEDIDSHDKYRDLPKQLHDNKLYFCHFMSKSKAMQKFHAQATRNLDTILKKEFAKNADQLDIFLTQPRQLTDVQGFDKVTQKLANNFNNTKAPGGWDSNRADKKVAKSKSPTKFKQILSPKERAFMGLDKIKKVPDENMVDLKKDQQKDELNKNTGNTNSIKSLKKHQRNRSQPMTDFQYVLKDRMKLFDDMIKDMESGNEGFKNDLDQFQDDIQALEKEKSQYGGLNFIPGQKIENLMQEWGEEQNDYDDDYSLKKYARTLWITLNDFENNLKTEQTGHEMQINFLHNTYRNKMEDLKHKTSIFIASLEQALYDTKTKKNREIEQLKMTIEEIESSKLNQIKTKSHVSSLVNKIRDEMVFRTVKEARKTIDQLCDDLESKQAEVDIKEGQIFVAKQMEVYYLDRQANDTAMVQSMRKTMNFYQSIIFKFVRDTDLFADDKEKWEKFTMIKQDGEKVEDQAQNVMQLKEILLQQKIIDYCNRYYGMEENVQKLDEALKEQGLLPEKLVSLLDLQKVKDLELMNKKRGAPKRAVTSAFLNLNAPITLNTDMGEAKNEEEQQNDLIDRSNEHKLTTDEKKILSGGFTKVLNASKFEQKQVQRELQLVIDNIKDGKLEQLVATANSGHYKEVKKPDYEKHIKKRMKLIREREERQKRAEQQEITAMQQKVQLEVTLEREKLEKKMAKLNAQVNNKQQSSMKLNLPKQSSANVVNKGSSSNVNPQRRDSQAKLSKQVGDIKKGLQSALKTPGSSVSQSLASSANKKGEVQEFGSAALLIERTPEGGVVDTKKRFKNNLRDSSSESNSSASQSESEYETSYELSEEEIPAQKKKYGTKTGAGKRIISPNKIRGSQESGSPSPSNFDLKKQLTVQKKLSAPKKDNGKQEVVGILSSIQSVSSVTDSVSDATPGSQNKAKPRQKRLSDKMMSPVKMMTIESNPSDDDDKNGQGTKKENVLSKLSAKGSFTIKVNPRMPYRKSYDEESPEHQTTFDVTKLSVELKQKQANNELKNLGGQSEKVNKKDKKKKKKKAEKVSEHEQSDNVVTDERMREEEKFDNQNAGVDKIFMGKSMSQPVQIQEGENQNKISKIQELILEKIKKIYPKLFNEDANLSSSGIKMNVQQIQHLQQVVQKCLGEKLLFDDNQKLFVKDPLGFVDQANQIIVKYFKYAQFNDFVLNPAMDSGDDEKVANKKIKQAKRKCPELGHILMPTISKDGLIMGFQIRYQMVQQAVEVMVSNDVEEDEIVTWVKRLLKAAIYFCRMMRDGLKQDYALQEVEAGKIKITTASFSQQVNSDDIDAENMKDKLDAVSEESQVKDLSPDQIALNLLKSHAAVVAARVRPSKKPFYDMVWENHDFKKLLDQKLENVFYNSKELTVQEYLEAIFKEIGNAIKKLDKDSIFKLDVAKLFEERVLQVEVQKPTSVMKQEISKKSINSIPEEDTSETMERQDKSLSQVSEIDSNMLTMPHDLVNVQNRYVGPLDTALYTEFLQTVKMFDKYADTVPNKKKSFQHTEYSKPQKENNEFFQKQQLKIQQLSNDTASSRLKKTNYQKFKPHAQLRESLQVLQKKLRDQTKQKLIERSTEEALTQQYEQTYSFDQTGLDIDISKSICTPSNSNYYNENSNFRHFQDPRATVANINSPFMGQLNASVQFDKTNNWQDMKRQLYTSQDNQNRNSSRALLDVHHVPDFNAEQLKLPKQNSLKPETHTVIAGLLKKHQKTQIKNIQHSRPQHLIKSDLLRYSTGNNSEEDLASHSLQRFENFHENHDNILSKTINAGEQEYRLLRPAQGQLRNVAPLVDNLRGDPSKVLKRNRILVTKTDTSKDNVCYTMPDQNPQQVKSIKSQIRGIQPHVIPHGIAKVPTASFIVKHAIQRAGTSFEDKDNDFLKTMSNQSIDHISSFTNQGIMSQAVKNQRTLAGSQIFLNKEMGKRSPTLQQLKQESTRYTQSNKKWEQPSDSSRPLYTQLSQVQKINSPDLPIREMGRMRSIDKDNMQTNFALISPNAAKQIMSPQPSQQFSKNIILPESLVQKIHQPQFSFSKYQTSNQKVNKTKKLSKRRVMKKVSIETSGEERNPNDVRSYSTINQQDSPQRFVSGSIKMS